MSETTRHNTYFWCRFSDAYQGTPCDHEECKIYLRDTFNQPPAAQPVGTAKPESEKEGEL